jgi:hypothetical protein
MKKSKVVLFIILVTTNLLLVPNQIQEVLSIQIFLFSLSFLTDVIQIKFAKNKNITPSHFLTINFVRIFLCVIFLLPTILTYTKSDNTYIYNFFIVYFIYLFSDIVFKQKFSNKINI